MNAFVRRALSLGVLLANLALVLLTLLAYDQGWDNGYWPIFLVWAALTVLMVVLAFFSKTPSLAPSSNSSSGGHQHE